MVLSVCMYHVVCMYLHMTEDSMEESVEAEVSSESDDENKLIDGVRSVVLLLMEVSDAILVGWCSSVCCHDC